MVRRAGASGKVGRWTYFRRYASTQPGDAERRVEADFKECGDGRLEAENSGLWGFSGMITVLRPRLDA